MSLLLCVATGILWIRSYWAGDWLRWQDATQRHRIETRTIILRDGGMGIVIEHTYLPVIRAGGPVYTRTTIDHSAVGTRGYPGLGLDFPYITDMRAMGFEFAYGHNQFSRYQGLGFPLAAIFFLGLLPPVLWARMRTKQRRRPQGNFCATCNYDLRATPDRCPECGTVNRWALVLRAADK
jgi:hypothetical protein